MKNTLEDVVRDLTEKTKNGEVQWEPALRYESQEVVNSCGFDLIETPYIEQLGAVVNGVDFLIFMNHPIKPLMYAFNNPLSLMAPRLYVNARAVSYKISHVLQSELFEAAICSCKQKCIELIEEHANRTKAEMDTIVARYYGS